MKPFPRYKRLTYLAICVVIFIVSIPLVALYASGYRIGTGFDIVKTGGVFVRVEEGSELYVNEKLQKGAGSFNRGLFVQDLLPGMYEVSVIREGFESWNKRIQVEEGLVSEASAFLFPKDLEITSIPQIHASSTSAEIEKWREAEGYFIPDPKPVAPVSGGEVSYAATRGDIALWFEGGTAYVKWQRTRRAVPHQFCIYTVCRTTYSIFSGESPVIRAEFFPSKDDAVIIATKKAIYALEIDKTPPQHRYVIYEGKNVDFRLNERTRELFIRDGNEFKVTVL